MSLRYLTVFQGPHLTIIVGRKWRLLPICHPRDISRFMQGSRRSCSLATHAKYNCYLHAKRRSLLSCYKHGTSYDHRSGFPTSIELRDTLISHVAPLVNGLRLSDLRATCLLSGFQWIIDRSDIHSLPGKASIDA